jgi:hypothetical protein
LSAKAENRSEDRSNVFLSAVLESDGRSGAVRIRNISASGALIEADRLPSEGGRTTLIRGQLRASGVLAWKNARSGGLTFDEPIAADEWIRRIGHEGQEQVDSAIASIRRDERPPGPSRSRAVSIGQVSEALDLVCESLADVPTPSVELSEAILKLDAIAQSLRRLATGMPF